MGSPMRYSQLFHTIDIVMGATAEIALPVSRRCAPLFAGESALSVHITTITEQQHELRTSALPVSGTYGSQDRRFKGLRGVLAVEMYLLRAMIGSVFACIGDCWKHLRFRE